MILVLPFMRCAFLAAMIVLALTRILPGQSTALQPQSITFGAIPDQFFGLSPFLITAAASSGLPVAVNSTTPEVCKTASILVTIRNPGTCSITVSQSGNATWAPTAAVRSFAVNLAKPSSGLVPASQITVGQFPSSLVAGDFNRDGIPDLAAGNSESGSVSVLLGNGAGGFTPAPDIPIQLFSSLAVADFNRDGIADIAALSSFTGAFTILIGDGSGSFTAMASVPTAHGPSVVTAGDFNQDGIPDLAVVTSDVVPSFKGLLQIFPGNGDGTFSTAPGGAITVGVALNSIVVGDFNGDGMQDLAIGDQSGTIAVLLGNGSGGFTQPAGSPFATGESPSLVVGDFNRDGFDDLAAPGVAVWLGNGAGGLSSPVYSLFEPGDAISLSAGDFNGDGILDLVSTDFRSDTVTLFLGNGSGGFVASANSPFSIGPGPTGAGRTAVADFNGDGVQDLAVASAEGDTLSILLGQPVIVSSPAPLQMITVSPCRIMDTRNANSALGGPFIGGGTTRTIPVPLSACGVPANAAAYSLNFTVVPRTGALGYLSVWPTAQGQPLVSTLNSLDGSIIANAAIVPAGSLGSIDAYATDDTDLIVDINGYFVPPASSSLQFYPQPPCRVLDTRNPDATFGGPSILGGDVRSFPIGTSTCGAANAAAYSLNVTVVPNSTLGYLTAWPTGQSQPVVSTLNSLGGTVLANAAIVPGGTNGEVSFFATDTTDLVVDINGYFAPPGSGGLNFYPVTPCRLVDTRNPDGTLGGPVMPGQTTRSFTLTDGACGLPGTAQAYSLNMTVAPQASTLGYLSTWPAGGTQPVVSTLNALKAQIVANAAIVPAGSDGGISVFVTDTTQVIVDTNGYFAP
jgi:FG-GAP-like repeat/FG-GAP repeat